MRESLFISFVVEIEGIIMEESLRDKDKVERKRKVEIVRLCREKIMV